MERSIQEKQIHLILLCVRLGIILDFVHRFKLIMDLKKIASYSACLGQYIGGVEHAIFHQLYSRFFYESYRFIIIQTFR